MEKKENKKLSFEIARFYIQNYFIAYVAILGIITFLELYMIIRAVLNVIEHSGFNSWDRVLYFVTYVVLFLLSAVTLGLLLYNRKRKTIDVILNRMLDVYVVVILLWSATISFLDIRHDQTMIVFMTVIMCVAASTNIRPLLYSIIVTPLSLALLFFAYTEQSPLVTTRGYAINFLIFVFFANLLAVIKYRLYRRNYIATRELERISFYDQLTDVYNRHSLKAYFDKNIKNKIFYTGLVDVDDFKSINDTFGHDIGDQCLKEIADELKAAFGPNIYRYGGDEFVVICDLREKELSEGISDINSRLAECFPEFRLHLSAGFYCPVSKEEEYTDILRKADEALYNAKNTGKNKTVIYKES